MMQLLNLLPEHEAASATRARVSSRARSRRMWTSGTRPRRFPRELYAAAAASACSASVSRRNTAARRPTAGYRLVATEELARAGSGGLIASLFSHGIGLPPIVAHGSEALKRRVVPGGAARREDHRAGDHRALRRLRRRRLRTSARLDGGQYVVNG